MANGTNGANHTVSEVLYRLNVNSKIDLDLLEDAFDKILSDKDIIARDVQLGALLTGIMAKGPTIDEIVTLLNSTFKLDGFSPYQQKKINLPKDKKLVGAIGSGKKGIKTMNISTPALIITAAAGAFTAKSVSSSTSSITGSTDLMRELGVNTSLSTEEMENVVRKTGFGVFCIENLIPKFDSVYAGKFYVPHTLSFGLAALVSPIQYDNFLYGLAHPNIELSIKVLERFGIKNAMVVSTTHDGIHYLDEMGVYGTTRLVGIRNGEIGKTIDFCPTEKLGLPYYSPKDIAQGSNMEENVKYSVDVLRGRGEGAREDIICINAGTILYLAEMAEDLKEGYGIAKNVVRTGAPLEKLLEVINFTRGNKGKLYHYLKK